MGGSAAKGNGHSREVMPAVACCHSPNCGPPGGQGSLIPRRKSRAKPISCWRSERPEGSVMTGLSAASFAIATVSICECRSSSTRITPGGACPRTPMSNVAAKSSIAPSAALSNFGSYVTPSISARRWRNTSLSGHKSSVARRPVIDTGVAFSSQSSPRQRRKNSCAGAVSSNLPSLAYLMTLSVPRPRLLGYYHSLSQEHKTGFVGILIGEVVTLQVMRRTEQEQRPSGERELS